MRPGQFAALLAASSIIVAPAVAQTRDMRTLWTIEAASAPEGVRHLASKEFVLKQRLLPTGLVELGDAAAVDHPLPPGTQLIQVQNSMGAIFCEGELKTRSIGGRAQQCFVDADFDQRFESWFKSVSATPAFVTISGRVPKKLKPLGTPLSYRHLDPAQAKFDAFVGIERRNFFNLYSLETFQIVFGSGGREERITHPVSFKSEQMPKELTVLGARFTAMAEKDGKMAVEVHSAMPPQPFGVMQTITYRFY